MSNCAKEFIAIYLVFKDVGRTFCGTTKPVKITSYIKPITRLLQTKRTLPPWWSAWKLVLQINFIIARFAGSMNNASDILSPSHLDGMEKLFPKTKKDRPTKPIEVNRQFTGNPQEEPVFFGTRDLHETLRNHSRSVQKKHAAIHRNIPTEWQFITVLCHFATDLHKETIIVNIAQLTKPSRILIQQNPDYSIANAKGWF